MQLTVSNKPIVQHILKACLKYGVKHVIISPGSRNAPLTISFASNSVFNCYSIPDERSAAFHALGMAKKLNEPVALVCTSGTAVLNYAPAIAEAYYQEIPLIVITADRPPEWIDQEDGQTIRQNSIYKNYICYSGNLPIGNTSEDVYKAKQIIEEAFGITIASKKGPVHINAPFDEPLYETESFEFNENVFIKNKSDEKEINYDSLIEAWNSVDKIMIVAGVMQADEKLNAIISNLVEGKNAIVIAPSYSNLYHKKIISIPELIFNTIPKKLKKELKPDLLITIGGPVVSKATKLFLREYKPGKHFDIDFNEREIDTYLSLTNKIISLHSKVLSYVKLNGDEKSIDYLNSFLYLQEEKNSKSLDEISKIDKSDIQIFNKIFNALTTDVDLHFSNSTPIRYSELFKTKQNINYSCNRGTSGIDGNTSIASGFALVSKKQTLLITGDISFGYDSNAFWNNHVPDNFKVIVINNNGGNIFRIIPGPSESNSLAYFETPISKSIKHFCETYHILYQSVNSDGDIDKKMNELLNSKTCTILEIFTDAEISAKAYKNIFKKLRE